MAVCSKKLRTRSGWRCKNFFDQIVQHKTVAAGESLDKTGGVRSSLHGEGGQLQTGDPALGAGLQRGDVCFSGSGPSPGWKVGGFGRGEAQVGGAQLGQLTPGAQAGQR